MATKMPQMQAIHKTHQIHKMQQIAARIVIAMPITLQDKTAIVMQVTQQREIVTKIPQIQQKKETVQKILQKIQQRIAQAMHQTVQNKKIQNQTL